jgi:hypothetical protein
MVVVKVGHREVARPLLLGGRRKASKPDTRKKLPASILFVAVNVDGPLSDV